MVIKLFDAICVSGFHDHYIRVSSPVKMPRFRYTLKNRHTEKTEICILHQNYIIDLSIN